VRLAAIHAFFRYCAAEHPDQLDLCQRVLAVPFKRARSRPVEYLEFDEIHAVLTAIDRTTADGRRDYALLATMFNTGARVQEIVTLSVFDVRLQTPPHVRLFGKGRKERICPLWLQTAEILRALLVESGGKPLLDDPLFRNHRGSRLTRFGVRHILRKHCAPAQAVRPALANKRLHPTARPGACPTRSRSALIFDVSFGLVFVIAGATNAGFNMPLLFATRDIFG